jgi:pimeloyl-ACP methyl ester carboxylesterase
MQDHDTGYKLIFVHGAGMDASCWAAQEEFFKNSEAVTLPGHYADEFTDVEGRKSIDEYASWLHDWIVSKYTVDGMKDKVVLVGHSMGGAIVLTYALTYPEHLSGMVLAGTGSRLRVNHQILDLLQKDYPAAVDYIVANSFSAAASDEMRWRTREVMLRVPPQVTLDDFIACNNYDVTNELGRLQKIPTLIVTGAADVMTPPKLATALSEKIPQSRLEFIDAAGHQLFTEKPHQFNDLVDDFVGSLE